TAHRDLGAAAFIDVHVERQHNAIGADLTHKLTHAIGLLHRQAADDNSRDAAVHERADVVERANASTDLHLERGRSNESRDPVELREAAEPRTVESDDVKKRRARLFITTSDRDRIIAVDLLAIERALGEAHTFAATQINCWDHLHSATNLRKIAAPATL